MEDMVGTFWKDSDLLATRIGMGLSNCYVCGLPDDTIVYHVSDNAKLLHTQMMKDLARDVDVDGYYISSIGGNEERKEREREKFMRICTAHFPCH